MIADDGIKHLVECHCVLPQFRDTHPPVYHKFVVFSHVKNGNVISKLAQCNNCGIVHRVVDIMKSEILAGSETTTSIVTKNDIKLSMATNISSVLESYNVDVATWEEVAFIIETQQWNKHVVISREEKDGMISGKLLKITGQNSAKIETFSMTTVI